MRQLFILTCSLIFTLLLSSCQEERHTEIRERPLDTSRFEQVNDVRIKIDHSDQIRIWNLTSGTEVKGAYLHYKDDHIFINMEGGRKGKIHFDLLEEEDRHHVQFLEKDNATFRDDLIRRERKKEELGHNQFHPDKPPIHKPPVGNSKLKLVFFFADWFPPCKQMMPHIKEFERKHPNIYLEPVNIDHNQKLAQKLGIKKIPTLIFYKNEKEVKRVIGFQNYLQIKKNLVDLD